MNMLELLVDLKKNYAASALKVEFEAEGAGFDDALRLKELSRTAGLDFTVKIGGCEAVKDLKDAELLGASAVAVPMVESPYAFKKFITAAGAAFSGQLFINIETITGFNCLDEILESEYARGLHGIVLGRTDMCGSLGLGCGEAESAQILEYARVIAEKARLHGKKFITGGNISPKSMAFLNSLPLLDGCETRKVIFNRPSADGILKAIEFEMMWIRQTEPNSQRLALLERRYASVDFCR